MGIIRCNTEGAKPGFDLGHRNLGGIFKNGVVYENNMDL